MSCVSTARPSSSLIDVIDQKIMDFRGGAPVSDDLTLMVVHRLLG